MSMSESGVGGYKEVIAIIEGERVYSQMKWESGVHRVQRVPATKRRAAFTLRAVTVAVLPEAEESRREDRSKGYSHRYFLFIWPGWPVGEYYLFGCAHNSHSTNTVV